MEEHEIPQHLRVAKDVTDSEYRKALFQSRLTWIVTFSVPVVAFLYWLLVDATYLSADGAPPFKLAISWGILSNRLLYFSLKEGKKMGSLRMKQYPELKRFREARGQSR